MRKLCFYNKKLCKILYLIMQINFIKLNVLNMKNANKKLGVF